MRNVESYSPRHVKNSLSTCVLINRPSDFGHSGLYLWPVVSAGSVPRTRIPPSIPSNVAGTRRVTRAQSVHGRISPLNDVGLEPHAGGDDGGTQKALVLAARRPTDSGQWVCVSRGSYVIGVSLKDDRHSNVALLCLSLSFSLRLDFLQSVFQTRPERGLWRQGAFANDMRSHSLDALDLGRSRLRLTALREGRGPGDDC